MLNAGYRETLYALRIFGYGNHRLCRWRHPVKAFALSIERSELQVEVLTKELATSRT